MEAQKPNWTLLELHEKCDRQRELVYATMSHEHDCGCNECFELFGLNKLIGRFSKDEIAAAVIEARKQNGE